MSLSDSDDSCRNIRRYVLLFYIFRFGNSSFDRLLGKTLGFRDLCLFVCSVRLCFFVFFGVLLFVSVEIVDVDVVCR